MDDLDLASNDVWLHYLWAGISLIHALMLNYISNNYTSIESQLIEEYNDRILF